jgi:hypothetical protein
MELRRDLSPETTEGSVSSFVKKKVYLDEQSIEREKHETQRQQTMIICQLIYLAIVVWA